MNTQVQPTALAILDNSIRMLGDLYSLNDLHKASGGEEKHKTANFMRLEQTQELVKEICIENDRCSDVSIAYKTIKGGLTQGTYVCRELVYAYAMWISAKFHLLVIRAFDAISTRPTFDIAETLSQTLNQISNGNRKLYMSMYNGLSRCFAVSRLADIPHAEIHNALATIYLYAVEWHRKNDHTQLPLKLNDGEHYLVVKNGVVLWERKLKPHCNDIPANTLQNPKLMLEHIREVVGEFIGKETLPAPNSIVIDIPRENVKHNNTLMPNLHTLNTLYDGYGINGNPLVRLFATLVQAQKDGKPITVKDVSGARLVYEMTEALARQYNQALDNIKRAADNAYSSGMFLPIK